MPSKNEFEGFNFKPEDKIISKKPRQGMLRQIGGGVISGLAELPINAYNTVAPMIGTPKAPKLELGEGIPYEIAKFGGGLLLPGGAISKAGKYGAQALKAAPKLGAALGRIGAGSGLGAVTAQDNKVTGALAGGLTAVAFEALPAGIGLAKKGLDKLSPAIAAKDLKSKLTGMLTGETKKAQGEYSKVWEHEGIKDKNLYDKGKIEKIIPMFAPKRKHGVSVSSLENKDFNRLVKPSANENFITGEIQKNVDAYFSPSLKDALKDFYKKPSIEAAHELQSKLYKQISSLYKKSVDGTFEDLGTERRYEAYKKTREALLGDIKHKLKSTDPGLEKKYNRATRIWSSKVKPLEEAEGMVSSIGKSPSTKETSKIISEFDDKLRDISKKGRKRPLNTREKLEKRLYESTQKGVEGVENKINTKKNLEKLIGALSGLGLGHVFGKGLPFHMAEYGGALLGSMAGPALSKLAQKTAPIQKGIKKAYPTVSKGLTAALINAENK